VVALLIAVVALLITVVALLIAVVALLTTVVALLIAVVALFIAAVALLIAVVALFIAVVALPIPASTNERSRCLPATPDPAVAVARPAVSKVCSSVDPEVSVRSEGTSRNRTGPE